MNKMQRELLSTMLLPALLGIQGCVVVIGADTEDGVYWAGEESHSVNGIEHDGEHLSRDVARAIAADTDLVVEDARVSSEDGTVVLRGRVYDVRTLERALATTRNVPGVEHVISKIAIDAG